MLCLLYKEEMHESNSFVRSASVRILCMYLTHSILEVQAEKNPRTQNEKAQSN